MALNQEEGDGIEEEAEEQEELEEQEEKKEEHQRMELQEWIGWTRHMGTNDV